MQDQHGPPLPHDAQRGGQRALPILKPNNEDRTPALASFADNAHETDDGHDYHGTTEIQTWLTNAAREYTFTVTPTSAHTDSTNHTTVTCHVAGTFPGSPVDLDYHFHLNDTNRITRLEIALHEPQPTH